MPEKASTFLTSPLFLFKAMKQTQGKKAGRSPKGGKIHRDTLKAIKALSNPKAHPETVAEWAARRNAHSEALREAARELAHSKTIEVRANVSPYVYGMLSQAAVIYDCTPQEALARFLNDTDVVMDWSNDDFVLEAS